MKFRDRFKQWAADDKAGFIAYLLFAVTETGLAIYTIAAQGPTWWLGFLWIALGAGWVWLASSIYRWAEAERTYTERLTADRAKSWDDLQASFESFEDKK